MVFADQQETHSNEWICNQHACLVFFFKLLLLLFEAVSQKSVFSEISSSTF